MRSKKVTPYDAEELKLQAQSASIVDYLKRKGIVEDTHIDNEKIRKAQQSKAQKAYHNTEVLLNQYRMVVWVLECIPGEIAAELLGPVKDVDELAEKLDLQMSLENKRVESRGIHNTGGGDGHVVGDRGAINGNAAGGAVISIVGTAGQGGRAYFDGNRRRQGIAGVGGELSGILRTG